MRPSANDCWLPTAAFASSSSQLPALLLAKCLLCCKQIAIGHGSFAFDSRGSALPSWPMAANGKAKRLLGGGSWGILQPHRRRGGSGSGRCVSARTREGSKQPLPLHPAIAIRLRQMANVLGGGGEWPSLAELLAAAAAAAAAIGPFVSAALPALHSPMAKRQIAAANGKWQSRLWNQIAAAAAASKCCC